MASRRKKESTPAKNNIVENYRARRITAMWNSWASARVAKDRDRWRQFIQALCASGHKETR